MVYQRSYQRFFGSQMYSMISTRPDTAYNTLAKPRNSMHHRILYTKRQQNEVSVILLELQILELPMMRRTDWLLKRIVMHIMQQEKTGSRCVE